MTRTSGETSIEIASSSPRTRPGCTQGTSPEVAGGASGASVRAKRRRAAAVAATAHPVTPQRTRRGRFRTRDLLPLFKTESLLPRRSLSVSSSRGRPSEASLVGVSNSRPATCSRVGSKPRNSSSLLQSAHRPRCCRTIARSRPVSSCRARSQRAIIPLGMWMSRELSVLSVSTKDCRSARQVSHSAA